MRTWGWILGALLAGLPGVLLAGASRCLYATTGAAQAPPSLTVSLAVEQPTVVQPFPARLLLRLKNTGPNVVWLYHPVRDARELARAAARTPEGEGENWSSGGSSVLIHLEPAAGGARSTWAAAPHAEVLLSPEMPQPRLVKLDPGGERDETVVVALAPGLQSQPAGAAPVWGRYRLSLSYSAVYSNAGALARDLGADVWQGEAAIDPIDVDLEPAPQSSAGGISGRVTDERGGAVRGALVSLSGGDERLVGQTLTGDQGQYAFNDLPAGRYFLTARRPGAASNTVVYDHADVGAGADSVALSMVLLEREVTEPRDLLHKPVLIRVTGDAGQPLEGVQVDALWSSGSVADNVRGETDASGAVALDLLPGRSYLTLKRRKCSKQDSRVDVAEGDGIDGSILQYSCQAR